jgi:hypothetical protein
MNHLCAPLAVVERDDDEFTFFSSIDDMLSDRFDILWGEAYDGWDAAGQYFSLVRSEPSRTVISSRRSSLAIECVRPASRTAEAQARIRRALKSSASNFAGLLAEGVVHTLFGTAKR